MLRDRLHHLFEAAAGGLHSDLLAQGVCIELLGQVQLGVEGMQALLPWGALAAALDLHRAEEALQRAAVQTPLRTLHAVLAHTRRPDVAHAAALQPALQELAEDLAALPLDEIFGLTVRQISSDGREQLLDQVFKLHTGLVKWFLGDACGVLHPLGPPGKWPTVFFTINLPQFTPMLKH
jgi:hypothetical protein